MTKGKIIDEVTDNLLRIERKFCETSKERNVETFEDKVDAFEKKLFEKIDDKIETFKTKLFEDIKESVNMYSKYMKEACTSIDDMIVELNDDIGNITIESEDNPLLETFENPF